MYKNIFEAVSKEFSGKIAKQNIAKIHYSDKETAKWCADKMREIGLAEVELISCHGIIDTITGVIPGVNEKKKGEEILVISHDNASGCRVSLEVARTLVNLINKKILLKPERTIRFILMHKIFALASFFKAKKNKNLKIIAGINLDIAGEDEDKAGTNLVIGKSCPSFPSYVNDFLVRLIEETDKDTPDNVGVVIGTCLYFFATSGLHHVCWLGEEMVTRARTRLFKNIQDSFTKFTGSINVNLESFNKRLNYLMNIETNALSDLLKLVINKGDKVSLRNYVHKLSDDLRESVEKFYKDIVINLYNMRCVSLKEVINLYNKNNNKHILKENKFAHSLIPEQTFSGIPLSWILSEKDSNVMLNWVDGKRTIAEIFNIISLINKIKLKDLIKFFKYMGKNGYIKFKKNDRIKKQEIIKDLKKMGIKKRDVLFVHSSFKSIGVVEGGAETVVEALVECVGKEGIVIVPTLSFSFLGGYYAFNPKKTPSRVGEITNALLRRKDVFRSEHPTHSISAVGKGAGELVTGHKGSTFAKESPYGKYVKLNAKVIFIGTGLGCNTTLHAIEDWLDLPYLTTEKAIVERDAGMAGKEEIVKVTKSPSGCRDFYKKDSKIEKVFKKSGIIKKSSLGNADVVIIRAKDIVNTTIREIEKGRLDILLCDNPKCKFCTNGKKLLKKNQTHIMKKIKELKKIGLYF
ncbi:MAG: AAC(3) family N-acetyltransferase [Candidatus Firestonebacteria bacterium]